MSEAELRRQMDVRVLLEYYSSATASEINKYIGDFMPYINNFGTIRCAYRMQSDHKLLFLDCPIFVAPSQGGGYTASRDHQEIIPLCVEVFFPLVFPSVPPTCRVKVSDYRHGKVTKWSIRQPSHVVSTNGVVQLPELSLLRGTAPPYSLLEILLALTEQFELDFPLIPANEVLKTDSLTTPSKGPNVSSTMSSKERSAIERQASELLMLHLLSKAEGYLETREKALHHLSFLYQYGGRMREFRALLEQKKDELLQYSPNVERVNKLIETLTPLQDNMEVHSKCIVPVDELQSRALELLGEIHASDDSLDLLERSLKVGQLTCEEYVRRVSDVGRKQFEARFLFGRVADAVNCADVGSGHRLPSNPPRPTGRVRPGGNQPLKVPQKLDSAELLLKEFPEVGLDMVRAVLNVVDGNVADARVQLQAMLS